MRSPPRFASTWVLAGLTAATCVVAAWMAQRGLATWLEVASFVTGAVCVWLTVKENVWNFPIGLVNVATFCVVFYRSRLFADAGLQAVYFVLGVIGWYLWAYGGERKTELKITLASAAEQWITTACAAAMTIVLWRVLRLAGGSASFWDALTSSISIAAQWLLNKKRLQNWIGWIVVDVIYVPLYLYKGLYLTAILYGVFLVMAVMGYLQWRATWRKQRVEERGFEVVFTAGAI